MCVCAYCLPLMGGREGGILKRNTHTHTHKAKIKIYKIKKGIVFSFLYCASIVEKRNEISDSINPPFRHGEL